MSGKTKKKSKKWIIALVVIVLLAAAVLLGGPLLMAGRQGAGMANVKTASAKTGVIEKTVTGTGNLSAEETTQDITVAAGLAVDEIMVEAGDVITAGDVLATFDATELQAAIWSTQSELDSLDVQLTRLKGQTEPQDIRTAVAGRVKQIFAAEGDLAGSVVSRDGALIVLSIDGKMKVVFPAATGLAVGDEVTVRLSDGSEAEGTVQAIAAGQCEVTLSDEEAAAGDPVTILSADGTTLGNSPLQISQPLAITATDGTVDEVLVELNDKVAAGAKLIRLDSAPISESFLKLYVQRQDKAADLTELLGYAQSGALLAPCDGYVLSAGQTSAAGTAALTAAAASAGSSAAFTIRTAVDTRLSINIDELDIAALAVGQVASINIDALPDLELSGTIVEIARDGQTIQGNTTFRVTLDIPEDDSLRLGLSATAVITVAKRENIVLIPLEALQESGGEQYVYVGQAVSETELGEKRLVTTGISDGKSVEIISGLADGEQINYYYNSGSNTLYPFYGRNGNSNATTAD